jgi:hypothetical protein
MVATIDQHLRLVSITDTVARRVRWTYLIGIAFAGFVLLATLVYARSLRPRLAPETANRVGLMFLMGCLMGWSLVFLASAVFGPRAVFRRRSDRPPLLYRLRRAIRHDQRADLDEADDL